MTAADKQNESCQWPGHPNNIKCLTRHIPPPLLPPQQQSTEDKIEAILDVLIMGYCPDLIGDINKDFTYYTQATHQLTLLLQEARIDELDNAYGYWHMHGGRKTGQFIKERIAQLNSNGDDK